MSTAQAQNKCWFLPDLADFIFVLVLYITLFVRPDMILIDGSTGWHLVSGNYILQHHCVPQADIVSYTFAGKPWIAYEWLSDLIMAALVKLGGLTLLEVTVACAIAFLFFLLYKRCRENGGNFVLAILLTIIGTLVSAIHWLARPHLFTFFGVYVFATQLDRYYRGAISGKKLAISLCLCMLVWANCHPGFLIGLGLIGIYLTGTIIEYLFLDKSNNLISKTVQTNRLKTLSATLALNIITTLCNPYGFGLYSYISHYLFKTNSIIGATDEFLSPVFHGGMQPALLEALFAFFIIGLAINKTRISLSDLFVYIVFAYLSLSAQRNMALYVIVALPIIARLYSDTIFSSTGGKLYEQLNEFWRRLITKFEALNKDFTINERLCSVHLLPIIVSALLIGAALNGGQAFGFNILNIGFPQKNIPGKTLSIIKDLRLDPKQGMAFDNWGGILRYKLDYPVFIDDRADFYGEQFYTEYVGMVQALPGWQNKLDKYQINWVLMPHNNRLINELNVDSNWAKAGEDQASVLMIRKSSNSQTREK